MYVALAKGHCVHVNIKLRDFASSPPALCAFAMSKMHISILYNILSMYFCNSKDICYQLEGDVSPLLASVGLCQSLQWNYPVGSAWCPLCGQGLTLCPGAFREPAGRPAPAL